MKAWKELSKKEQGKVAYNWLQSEGYGDDGSEYDTPESYYYGTRMVKLTEINKCDEAMVAVERGEITGAN